MSRLPEITLYHGNCLDILINLSLDSEDTILVSDPPFNIGYHYKEYKDSLSEDGYRQLIMEVFYKKPSVIVHYPEMLHQISLWFGYAPDRCVSWVYNSNTSKQHRDIAFYKTKPNFKQVTQSYKNPNDKRIQERIARGILGGKLYDWWNINQVKNVSKDKTAHPCQMPLEVMKRVVGILPKTAIIVDPFMGSGTTGAAVLEMNKEQNAERKFVGIELDKSYFEISEKRLLGIQKGETLDEGNHDGDMPDLREQVEGMT